MHRVSNVSIAAADGGAVPMRILIPTENSRGAIVYFHGGGWVLGTLDQFDTLARELAARSSCTVVLVDYRLSPEHRFPIAVEDAWSAVQWVDLHIEDLAGAGAPLIVAGDSSGGNLAAVVAQRARGTDTTVALQVLVYPITDCDLDRPSYLDPDCQLLLDRRLMEWFWAHYLPDPSRRTDPEASPLRAESLAGLPPAVVVTAGYDVLRDEGTEYARRLAEAGVAVEHRHFERQMHLFFTLVNVVPASGEAIDYVVAAVRRCLAAPAGPTGSRQ